VESIQCADVLISIHPYRVLASAIIVLLYVYEHVIGSFVEAERAILKFLNLHVCAFDRF